MFPKSHEDRGQFSQLKEIWRQIKDKICHVLGSARGLLYEVIYRK